MIGHIAFSPVTISDGTPNWQGLALGNGISFITLDNVMQAPGGPETELVFAKRGRPILIQTDLRH